MKVEMASFQKRGKTWQYTVSRMVDGVSQPIRKGGFRTKGEAQAAATEVESDLNKGITPYLKPEPFDKYFEEWIKVYKPDIGDNTRARYKNTLETIKEYFPGKPIQDFNKRMYQEFLNKYGKTRAKDTVKKLNTHIRACVREAVDEGIIRVDFTRGVAFSGSVASKRPEEKHLNYFDSKRLLKYLTNNLNSLTDHLILLGLTSGLRYGELVGLTRADFDFKNNILNIDKTWGYTNKMHEGFGDTKNRQSVRKIKMDKKTMALFKKLFEVTPPNIHGLVFYSPQSKYKVLSNGGVNKAIEIMLNELKIDTITVHGLRHTHASVLLYKKASIYYVSERLGHKDIETTMKHYAHIIKELREQDEKIAIKTFESMII